MRFIGRSSLVSSIRPRIASAIDQQVLCRDVARPAPSRGTRNRRRARPPARSARPGSAPPARSRSARTISSRSTRPRTCSRCPSVSNGPGSRLLIVTLCFHRLPRKAGREADQAGARAVRQAELELRDLHAARHDVDDAAEAARHHAVDGEPHHLDVAQHHGVDRRDPVVARPGAEIARQPAVGIVHQDVGLRAGLERGLAPLRRRDVGRDRA